MICPKCDGTGVEWEMISNAPNKDACSFCEGKGKVEKPIKFAKNYPVTLSPYQLAMDLKCKEVKRKLNELEDIIKGKPNK